MSIIKYANIFITVASLLAADGRDLAGHSWEYYFERAQAQYRGEMLDYAIHSLERCLDANPRCYEAANLMARIYFRKNLKERSIDYYRRSLEINDRQADIHYSLGELYEFYIERDLAFREYARAVEIEPDHPRANCSLVRMYLAKNDQASARSRFEISYRQGKAVSGKLLSRAVKADRNGNDKKAIELYGKVIEEAPAMIEAYLALYEVHRRRNDYARAAEVLERLIVVKPDHEKAYLYLGYVYSTQKLPGRRAYFLDRAIQCYKKALELNPGNYDACYDIAGMYKYIGRDLDARSWEEKGRAIEEGAEKERSRQR
jgi:tetratricopeptide (TPR) repeat protein